MLRAFFGAAMRMVFTAAGTSSKACVESATGSVSESKNYSKKRFWRFSRQSNTRMFNKKNEQ